MDEAEWNDFCFLLLSFLRSISFSRRHFPLSLAKSSLLSCIHSLHRSLPYSFFSFSLSPLTLPRNFSRLLWRSSSLSIFLSQSNLLFPYILSLKSRLPSALTTGVLSFPSLQIYLSLSLSVLLVSTPNFLATAHLLFSISRVFSLSRHFLKSYSSSPFRYFYSSPIAFSSAFLPRHFSV